MQDKTIAFIGDSLGQQHFQFLMCMATGGEVSPEVEDIGREYDLVKHRGSIRPYGWVYRFPKTNTTILYYWLSTLADLVPINVFLFFIFLFFMECWVLLDLFYRIYFFLKLCLFLVILIEEKKNLNNLKSGA